MNPIHKMSIDLNSVTTETLVFSLNLSKFANSLFSYLKRMLPRKIEHFLMKRRYEKIGYSEINKLKKKLFSVSNGLYFLFFLKI